jgi:hypothetical protein
MSTPSLSLVSYPLICLRTSPSTLPQAHPGGQPHNLPSTGQRVNIHRIPLPSPLHLITAVEATSLGGLIILMALASMGTTSSSSVTRGTMVRAYMRRIRTTRRRQHRTRSPGTRVPPFPATQKKRTHMVAHIVTMGAAMTMTMTTAMAMSGTVIPRLLRQLDRVDADMPIMIMTMRLKAATLTPPTPICNTRSHSLNRQS